MKTLRCTTYDEPGLPRERPAVTPLGNSIDWVADERGRRLIRRVAVELQMTLPSVANLRERAAVWAVLRSLALSVGRPGAELLVTITRCAPRALHSDNFAMACKAVRDGVADWLGSDDGPRSGVEWVYRHEARPKRVGAPVVRIVVEEVER